MSLSPITDFKAPQYESRSPSPDSRSFYTPTPTFSDNSQNSPPLSGRVTPITTPQDKTRIELENGLDEWIAEEFKEREAEGQRVKDKILRIYDGNWVALDLMNCKLKTLFPEVGLLKSLRYLHLLKNGLTDLPESIQELSRLEVLDLGMNHFQKVPQGISKLSKLRWLDMHGNKLVDASLDYAKLQNLQTLILSGNQDLASLPLNIATIPGVAQLYIGSTKITEENRHQVLSQGKELRAKISSRELPKLLNALAEKTKLSNIGDLTVLSPKQIEDLYEWIIRINFITHEEKIYKMVQTIVTDETFRKRFFTHVSPKLEPCTKDITNTLNEIYPLWLLSNLPEDASTKEKIEIMQKIAKTYVLRHYLQLRIHQQKTEELSVEEREMILVYHETELRHDLSLICPIAHIGVPDRLGKREWITREDLEDRIKKGWLDELITFEPFKKLVMHDPNFKGDYEDSQALKEWALNHLASP